VQRRPHKHDGESIVTKATKRRATGRKAQAAPKVQESPPKVPWARGFSLMPPPPKDAAEERRFKLRADPRFKQWLQDLDAKVGQFEAIRRHDL